MPNSSDSARTVTWMPDSTSSTPTTAATPSPRRGVIAAISSPIPASSTASTAAPPSARRKSGTCSSSGSSASSALTNSSVIGSAVRMKIAVAIAAYLAWTYCCRLSGREK